MITIKAIDHIVLRTDNVRSMLDFYCHVLGCSLERDLGEEFKMQQLRAGNSLIDIVDVSGKLGVMGGGAPSKTENNMDHFCLAIEAVDQAQLLIYLQERSVTIGEFSPRYGAQGFGPSLYIEDPDGNTVELKLPPKPVA